MTRNRLPRRLGVVTHLLPGTPSGQSVMLFRFLEAVDPGDYCLLALDQEVAEASTGTATRRVDRPPDPRPRMPRAIERVLGPPLSATRSLRALLHYAREIARRAREERCRALLACSGHLYALPATYLASRWMRVPFYAYMFDDYRFQWPYERHAAFARLAERVLAHGAAGLIVPNEYLAGAYVSRYGVRPAVVHNAADAGVQLSHAEPLPWPAAEVAIEIVYTGSVYHAQADAFRNLIAAVRQVGRPGVRLHVHTDQTPAQLAELGIAGPVDVHPHVAQSEIRAVQRRADILFLPLSFEEIPEVIRTSAPGKMAEYLGSGRPILAHVPRDSFVADYLTSRGCGLVVDEANVQRLAKALRRLLDDEDLRTTLVERALEASREDFDLAVARRRFVEVFARPVGRVANGAGVH